MEDNLNRILEKESFLTFVNSLISDLKNKPEEWENKSLDAFLEAIVSWIEDMDGYYENNNIPYPQSINWQFFADVLMAAKIYE